MRKNEPLSRVENGDFLLEWKQLQTCACVSTGSTFVLNEWVELKGKPATRPLSDTEFATVSHMYVNLYGYRLKKVSRFADFVRSSVMCGAHFDSCSGKATYVSANWQTDSEECVGESNRLGQIRRIFKNAIHLETDGKIAKLEHVLVYIKWFVKHQEEISSLEEECTMWYTATSAMHTLYATSSYMPIQRIKDRCATTVKKVALTQNKIEKVIIATPLPSRSIF